MSKRTCRRTQIENIICEPFMDSRDSFGHWAYWCGSKQDGWRATPCEHIKEGNYSKTKRRKLK